MTTSSASTSELAGHDLASAWRPGPDVTDHVGSPIAMGRDFFVSPPAEIGAVVRAWSEVKEGQFLWVPMQKAVFGLGAAILVAVGAHALVAELAGPSGREAPLVAALVAGFLVAAITLWWAMRKKSVSYVGREGVAIYETRGSRSSAKLRLLRFADVVSIKSSQTRMHHNGIYTGTTFDFCFFSPDGKRAMRLKGSDYVKKQGPTKNCALATALSAELAWTVYFLQRAGAEMERTGGIRFEVNKADYIRVMPGALELHFKGESTTVTPDDIKSLGLGGGHFHVHTKEAKWFGGKGKFSFAYGNMHNARAFLFAIEKLVGYQFT